MKHFLEDQVISEARPSLILTNSWSQPGLGRIVLSVMKVILVCSERMAENESLEYCQVEFVKQ